MILRGHLYSATQSCLKGLCYILLCEMILLRGIVFVLLHTCKERVRIDLRCCRQVVLGIGVSPGSSPCSLLSGLESSKSSSSESDWPNSSSSLYMRYVRRISLDCNVKGQRALNLPQSQRDIAGLRLSFLQFVFPSF